MSFMISLQILPRDENSDCTNIVIIITGRSADAYTESSSASEESAFRPRWPEAFQLGRA